MLGFAQALIEKGARSVVLSRWKVDDAATALLMSRFYENLTGKGDAKSAMKRAEALREAKTWLRNLSSEESKAKLSKLFGGVPVGERGPVVKGVKVTEAKAGEKPYADAYYWAAFVLVGDPD
jgi:CHAT domain-containing protein